MAKKVRTAADVLPDLVVGGDTLVVTARTNDYHRAGHVWSKQPTTIPVCEFTELQLKVLFSDPGLNITRE
jgi:hypothetical protein